MMISPGSSRGISFSIKSSTGCPALTINITLRGRLNEAANSSRECVPIMFLPLALPLINSSTFETVRLKTATVKPLLSIFRTRFSPITARPINPISANFFILLFFIRLSFYSCISFPDVPDHFLVNRLCIIGKECCC